MLPCSPVLQQCWRALIGKLCQWLEVKEKKSSIKQKNRERNIATDVSSDLCACMCFSYDDPIHTH